MPSLNRATAKEAPIEEPKTAIPNGLKSDDKSRQLSTDAGQPRRRTNIEARTGNWELGKTIGAGSMGKVKLAKNKATGEQVRYGTYQRGQ